MPLFLNAEPASTGTSFSAIVERRIEARNSSAVNFFAVQIFFDERVVMLGNVFHRLFAMLFVIVLVRERKTFSAAAMSGRVAMKAAIPQLGDFKHFKFRAQRFLKPDDRFFFQEIDDADEKIFLADGALNRHRDERPGAARMVLTACSKSAPVRSILLMNAMRGT